MIKYAKTVQLDGRTYRHCKHYPGIWVDIETGLYVTVRNKTPRAGTPSYNRQGRLLQMMCCTPTANCKNVGALVLDAAGIYPTKLRKEVDHIDKNPANNKISNLRWVTHSENCQNRRRRKYNSSLLQQKLL